MANTVKIKHKATAGSSPPSLEPGELAINTADGKLFWENVSGVVEGTALKPNLGDLADVSDTVPSPNTSVYVLANVPGVGWSSQGAIGSVYVGSEPVGGWPAGSVGESLDGKASTSHASTHATGSTDALTPSDIGAAPAASPEFTGNATFTASSGVPLTVTNTGSGNSLVINDTSGDERLLFDGSGRLVIAATSATGGTDSTITVDCNDATGVVAKFRGRSSDGTCQLWLTDSSGQINSRIVSTSYYCYVYVPTGQKGAFVTSAGEEILVARNDRGVGIGGTGSGSHGLTIAKEQVVNNAVSAASFHAIDGDAVVASAGVNAQGVPNSANTFGFFDQPTLNNNTSITLRSQFQANGVSIPAGSTGTLAQLRGFTAGNADLRIPTQYGFYSTIQLTTNSTRYQFFADGSAPSRFDGVITVSSGSGASGSYAPAVAFTTDPNTGIQQIGGADTFSIVTGGNERVQVGASGITRINGRLGINSSPSADILLGFSGTCTSGILCTATQKSGSSCNVYYSYVSSAGTGPITHFLAQVTAGSGTPTMVVGFDALDAIATGATNYGFRSTVNKEAGKTNYQIYASGDAPSLFLGEIEAALGSAASPSYSFVNDTDSGLFRAGADSVATSTAGVERFRVKPTGSVRFVPLSSDPASGNEAGDVYYNSTSNKLRVYNGTSWVDLH